MQLFKVNTECQFTAEPCSNMALLYTFYGIAVAMSSRNIGYVSAVYAILLLLSLWSEFGLGVFDTTAHFGFGFISGFTIAAVLQTVLIAPTNVVKHKYHLVLYLVELAVAALIFVFVDEVVPENGFPVGLWMAFLAYVLWFGAVYFVNFKYGALETKVSRDVVLFTRTYLYWFLALVPYFVTASFLFLNRYVSGMLATALVLLVTLGYRVLTRRKTQTHST